MYYCCGDLVCVRHTLAKPVFWFTGFLYGFLRGALGTKNKIATKTHREENTRRKTHWHVAICELFGNLVTICNMMRRSEIMNFSKIFLS